MTEQRLDLIPCPFCGGAAHIDGTIVDLGREYLSVRCDECRVELGDFSDTDSAGEFWNRRYFSDEQIRMIISSECSSCADGMKKTTPDLLALNGYHRIMHLAVFLLGYWAASLFGVFILCYSLEGSLSVQLYPYFYRFLDLYIDWSAGFCIFTVLLYLSVDFIRCRYFPNSYMRENAFFSRWFSRLSAEIRGRS